MKEKTALIYRVYILPIAKYCGVTSRDLEKRLWEHRHIYGRDTTDAYVLKEFNNKRDALDFEIECQLKNGYSGYIFSESWRKRNAEKCRKLRPSDVNSKRIICLDTNEVFDSTRACERFYNASSGNLTRHLKGHPQHQTFKKMKFCYFTDTYEQGK